MKSRWHLEDLIDLEYFLHRVEREDTMDVPPADGREQDREIYLHRIKPQFVEGITPSRRVIVRLWLEVRRQMEKEEIGRQRVLPGELFSQVWRLVMGGFLVSGIVAGGWLATSLLSYRGTEPVNVSFYVAILVVAQAGLAAITTFFLLLRRRHWRLPGGVLYPLVRSLLATIMGWLRKRVDERVSGDRREEFSAVIGLIKGRGTVYGTLFFWPLFFLVQTFGIGFNLGGLASTGLRVVGTDLAFGWQSTLHLSAGAVHRLVRNISLPWSWALPPDIAAPSLSQIEGSRMILKDGIYHLSTADLVAWWPFLLLALCCYGLVPRLLLLVVGVVAQYRALARLDFNNSACDRLLQRLERPVVRLDGTVTPALVEEADRPAARVSMDDTRVLTGVALIPDDVFDNCSLDRLRVLVRQVFSLELETSYRIGLGLAADQQVLRQIAGGMDSGEPWSVVILQEAWHPPIRETLAFLQEIRAILGLQGRIGVGLIGKPAVGTIFTPVKDIDWQTWRRKIASLGDPNLRIERLIEDNERYDA
ncbi:MAG: DUF2868 domain-containing protein [Proteobacteria bacterium]|nr:DUF2868 domain-containing protein [Pseudomonadota bacterium]